MQTCWLLQSKTLPLSFKTICSKSTFEKIIQNKRWSVLCWQDTEMQENQRELSHKCISEVFRFGEGWTEVKFFRTLGHAWWGQQPLKAAYCLHGTLCLVLKDYCGKSISCCPFWDWNRFPVYLEFASPRRLLGRKWSLQSEVECVAADVKSKPLRPGTKGFQKPGSRAERGQLAWQRLCEVSSHLQAICVSVRLVLASELPESPFTLISESVPPTSIHTPGLARRGEAK